MRLIAALILAIALTSPLPAAAKYHSGYCIAGSAAITSAHFVQGDRATMLDTAQTHALLSLEGVTNWASRADYGYFIHKTAALLMTVQLSREGFYAGELDIFFSADDASEFLIDAYASKKPYARADGSYWGKHPACSYRVPFAALFAWLTAIY